MRYFALTILTCFFSINLIAQSGFIKGYDLGYSAVKFTNILLDEDKLLICGIARADTFPYPQGILFAQADTNGNILNQQFYLDSSGFTYNLLESPMGFIKSQNNDAYIFLGHTSDRNSGLLMSIDTTLQINWLNIYPDSLTRQDFFNRIVEVPNGYLIAGLKQKQDFWADAFVIKINQKGHVIWEKGYGLENDHSEHVKSFWQKNDNEFIIGMTVKPVEGASWQDWQAHTRMAYIKMMKATGYMQIEKGNLNLMVHLELKPK